jgi:hypothetical protein
MPSRSLRAWSGAAILGLAFGLTAIACGGAVVPPPSASVGVASPTPAAASSEPSADASPGGTGGTGSGSGADPDAGAALDAFRAFIQTDQSFHLQADMQITVAGETIDMDMAADVAGGDERGELIIRSGDASVAMELILLDGVAYAQLANRPWQVVPAEAGSSNPLLGLDVEGLEPMGTVRVGGTPTHHFRVDDPSAVDTSLIAGNSITEVEFDTLTFDVYVTDDGAPLAAVMEFAGSGTVEGARHQLNARIRYDFSKFGEPVTITKPTILASPSAAP